MEQTTTTTSENTATRQNTSENTATSQITSENTPTRQNNSQNTPTRQSKFSFFLPPASQVRPWRTMTIRQAYEYITLNVDAMQQTHRLRDCHDEKERQLIKRRSFAFATFSGTFTYRADTGLDAHSGLLCIDFDHLGNHFQLSDIKSRLIADPMLHTRLLFTSPSGDGLKWVIDIDLTLCDHATWFRAVSNYAARTYRLEADQKCSNISRSCFLPHDPHAYISDN